MSRLHGAGAGRLLLLWLAVMAVLLWGPVDALGMRQWQPKPTKVPKQPKSIGCTLTVAIKTERQLARNKITVVTVKIANRGPRDISGVSLDFRADPTVAYLGVKPKKHYNTTPTVVRGPQALSWSGIGLKYRQCKLFKVTMRVDDCLPEAVDFNAAAFIAHANNTKDCYVETVATVGKG